MSGDSWMMRRSSLVYRAFFHLVFIDGGAHRGGVHIALGHRLQRPLVGAGEHGRFKEFPIGVQVVKGEAQIRESGEDFIGGDHIARGGLGVHKGKGLALKVLQRLDIAVRLDHNVGFVAALGSPLAPGPPNTRPRPAPGQ